MRWESTSSQVAGLHYQILDMDELAMTLAQALLPLAVFIGFLGIAIGGRLTQSAVIVAAVLAGVDLLYRLLQ